MNGPIGVQLASKHELMSGEIGIKKDINHKIISLVSFIPRYIYSDKKGDSNKLEPPTKGKPIPIIAKCSWSFVVSP